MYKLNGDWFFSQLKGGIENICYAQAFQRSFIAKRQMIW